MESPALNAFLYRECHSLAQIARRLGKGSAARHWERLAVPLKEAVSACWDKKKATYRYRDRDSHRSPASEALYQGRGNGTHAIQRSLKTPNRLLIHLKGKEDTTYRIKLTCRGVGLKGAIEEVFSAREVLWTLGQAWVTTQKVYSKVDSLEVAGLEAGDQVSVHTVGYTQDDFTLLLPLWASIPTPRQAKSMLNRTLLDAERYGRAFGLPACPRPVRGDSLAICQNVSMLWNHLIGEGLLAYGYREEAAELVRRLMAAVIQSLKTKGAFYKLYHADSGLPSGERNVLTGLAPVGLFLETLGVQILSPQRVVIDGNNPFPWNVTVKYQGLTIARQAKITLVTFPGGQSITVTGNGPQLVSIA